MAPAAPLTIGKLARAAGVNVETVRYYQRRGLMPRPGRHYTPEQLARLRFIRRAQVLGFTLREIGALLRLDGTACGTARGLAERKRADIDARLRDLRAMRRTLDRLIRACASGRASACPIIESLHRNR
jgi:MerR family mercuric resistance operon transcriptional regulator